MWALLDLGYELAGERSVLHLPPTLAPVVVGVFPLLSKQGMPERAEAMYRELRPAFDAFYDDTGSIGKRYARMDEVGMPYCVTVDHTTLEDGTVTLRERDTMGQVRVPGTSLGTILQDLLGGRRSLRDLGPPVSRP